MPASHEPGGAEALAEAAKRSSNHVKVYVADADGDGIDDRMENPREGFMDLDGDGIDDRLECYKCGNL
jgi:hypothetical protein